MAKMADLSALGVTDLWSYMIGYHAGHDGAVTLLKAELENATHMGDECSINLCTSLLQALALSSETVSAENG